MYFIDIYYLRNSNFLVTCFYGLKKLALLKIRGHVTSIQIQKIYSKFIYAIAVLRYFVIHGCFHYRRTQQ